jgi:hypothetical protein
MKGDIVVDLFIGSGTTIMAAEKVGRCAYAMELDPLYVDVAIRRWKAATKADVVLAADGRTFEEITAARLAEGGAASPPPRPPALRTEPEGAEDWVALAEGRFASMDGTQT